MKTIFVRIIAWWSPVTSLIGCIICTNDDEEEEEGDDDEEILIGSILIGSQGLK